MKEKDTLSQYSKDWLEYQKNFIKESSYSHYHIIVKSYILPYFSAIPLKKINEEAIQKYVLYLLTYGKKGNSSNSGLAPKTVKDITATLLLMLKWIAKKEGFSIEKIKIYYPSDLSSTTIKTLSRQTEKKIYDAAFMEDTVKSFAIILTLNTGIRIGELCALQYKDFDLENKILFISKTLQRISIHETNPSQSKTKIIISLPKSAASIRTIPLSDNLIPYLTKYIDSNTPDTFFLTGTAKYTEPRIYRSFFYHFLVRNQIEKIRFHTLRHTFATRCIEINADYKSVSTLLGHSDINTTLNLYVHPPIEQMRKYINLVNNIQMNTNSIKD